MPLTVQDDSHIQFALRHTQINHSEIGKRLTRIASGLRLNQASDDAAGLAVGEVFTSQTRGLDAASRNIQDFMSLAQTAEAGLGEIQDMSQRMNELAIQASNGTLSTEDRQVIQTEIDQLVQEIDRQSSSAQFNGQPILDGSLSTTSVIGPNPGNTLHLSVSAANSSALGLAGVDVTTQQGAQSAISAAQGAVNTIATERANIGATMNRLVSIFDFTGAARENAAAAASRITDADIALEVTGLTTAQIRERAGLFGVAQGNINRQNAVRLLET